MSLVDLLSAKWQGWNECSNAVVRAYVAAGQQPPKFIMDAIGEGPSVAALEREFAPVRGHTKGAE